MLQNPYKKRRKALLILCDIFFIKNGPPNLYTKYLGAAPQFFASGILIQELFSWIKIAPTSTPHLNPRCQGSHLPVISFS